MAIVGQFHILRKVQALDGRDITNIKEPNVGKNLALKDEPSHDTAENVNIDLQV
jgi:hypothetical protein